jgi:hypothetical protein
MTYQILNCKVSVKITVSHFFVKEDTTRYYLQETLIVVFRLMAAAELLPGPSENKIIKVNTGGGEVESV